MERSAQAEEPATVARCWPGHGLEAKRAERQPQRRPFGPPYALGLYRLDRPRVSGRGQRIQRARRAVLWGLALFALAHFVLAACLQFDTRRPHDREYGARVERIRRRTGPLAGNPVTVFALGSSRFQLGLRAAQLEKTLSSTLGRPVVVCNFGSAGAGPLTALFNWRRLERDGLRPDLVLIEIHPASLNEHGSVRGGEMREELWPTLRFDWSDLAFVENHAGALRPGLRTNWLIGTGMSLYGRRLEFVTDYAPCLLPPGLRAPTVDLDESGQIVVPDEPLTLEQRQHAFKHAHDQYHACLQDFHLGGPGCEALRELLACCRNDGIAAALLVMPEGPEFRSWYPKPVWPAIRAGLDALATEHAVTLLDAHEWMAEDDFFDSHHLTVAGAKRFTERLAREEVPPLLQRFAGATE